VLGELRHGGLLIELSPKSAGVAIQKPTLRYKRPVMRRISLVFLIFLLIPGCGPEVVEVSSSQLRTAIEPRLVRVYRQPPAKYQILGDLQTTENLEYGPNKSVDPMIDGLITQTAAKGGNGVLLAIDRPGVNGRWATYSGYYRGEFVQFVVRMQPEPVTVFAQAIYVLED
jgi:hypothetical protein